LQPVKPNWYIHFGFHYAKAFGLVPRYRCRSCRKTFSDQTFSIDYYAKKVIDYRDFLTRHSHSESVRALGRSLKVSCGTVLNKFDRLSRQAVALHAELRRALDFSTGVRQQRGEQFLPRNGQPIRLDSDEVADCPGPLDEGSPLELREQDVDDVLSFAREVFAVRLNATRRKQKVTASVDGSVPTDGRVDGVGGVGSAPRRTRRPLREASVGR
jgi:transposase-like protein